MVLTYRANLQRNLTALEADGNIRHLAELAQTIQASLPAGLAVEGAQLVLTLAGGAELTVDLPPSGIQHGAADGKIRGSKDGDWQIIEAVAEAPKDGVVRGRRDGAWVPIEGGDGGDGGTGPGTGTAASRLSVPDWNTDAEYLPGDLVRYREVVWMARVETFANYAPPAVTSTVWQLFSFPDVQCDLPLSHRIIHQLQGSTYQTAAVSTLLDQLMGAAADHERRIAALE